MKKQEANEQKQKSNNKDRKIFSMWNILLLIIIINGIDILKKILTVSDYAIRVIDVFMVGMGVLALILGVVNIIKWFIERRKSAEENESGIPNI